MAAPSLDVDWEAVKAHAIIHGVRPAARHFGIDEDAACQRSYREGWLKQAGKAIVPQPLPISQQRKIVSNVSKPSEAARNALSDLGGKIRIKAAKVAKKGLDAAHKWDGEKIVRNAGGVKALVDTAEKAVGWANQPQVSTLRLELIAGSVGSADHADLPAIDVEAEVLPSNELKGIQGVDESTQDQND